MNTLDYFFVTGNLGAPASLYGAVSGAMGVGMILGAIVAGAFAQKIGLVRTLWLSLLALALMILAYARSGDIRFAILFIALAGVAQAALNVAVGPLLLQSTPREMIGRVSSILNPVITVATLVGAALGGYLDSTLLHGFSATLLGVHFGPVDTILTGAGVIALVGALFAMVSLWGVRLSVPQPTATPVAPEPPPVVALPPLAAEVEQPIIG
jgi:MFS family permease